MAMLPRMSCGIFFAMITLFPKDIKMFLV
jgi:hypothetical protein